MSCNVIATRALAALAGLSMAGIAMLAMPPPAAANGWGHPYHCCYGRGYWGYPRFGLSLGFGGYPYGYYAPGYYGAAYPPYGYPPPYPYYGPPRVAWTPPPAPPSATPPAQPFVVYFDFDKAT